MIEDLVLLKRSDVKISFLNINDDEILDDLSRILIITSLPNLLINGKNYISFGFRLTKNKEFVNLINRYNEIQKIRLDFILKDNKIGSILIKDIFVEEIKAQNNYSFSFDGLTNLDSDIMNYELIVSYNKINFNF